MKKNQKGLAPVLLLMLVVVVFVGIYIFVNQNWKSLNLTTANSFKTPDMMTKNNLEIMVSGDLKTITNKKHLYSITVPSSWEVVKQSNVLSNPYDTKLYRNDDTGYFEYPEGEVYITVNPEGFEINDSNQGGFSNPDDFRSKYYTLNPGSVANYPALKFTPNTKNPSEGGPEYPLIYLVRRPNGDTYYFGLTPPDTGALSDFKKTEQLYTQILSTFKFTQ